MLQIVDKSRAQKTVDTLCAELSARTSAASQGVCPVNFSSALLRLCLAQSCGKCVPCRVGLSRLAELVDSILDGRGDLTTISKIKRAALSIADSADCAIGFESARMLLTALDAFHDDFLSHIENGTCTQSFKAVSCVTLCPANVDIPGYISLTQAGRYDDAVRLIRKDNPFPSTCALICEHPCESHCRRSMVDDAINIRGIKRYAVDHAGYVPAPACGESTGKTVAIIGGGPSGLTAAYFLALMGHDVTVYEKRKKLGGMLRYGIPCYRLPDEYLEYDIQAILETGIKVVCDTDIGGDVTIDHLREKYDAVYLSIGAHSDKKLGIPGESSRGVYSAVDMLRSVGDGATFDFAGKDVVVIGGGNVAMDATRTAKRLGAKSVKCVYRRRKNDMTALPDEVEGAIAEGCEIKTLLAPVAIECDSDENVTAVVVKPQIIGPYSKGRPMPYPASAPEERIPCDAVIVAIGQNIDSEHFAEHGIPSRWNMILTDSICSISETNGVFAGGDCVSGPSTVIRAIEAGKVASRSIDSYLGFDHEICVDVDIPPASHLLKTACGRVNMSERDADERVRDFEIMERGMSDEELMQECSRCLRCDHFGYGSFKGGRIEKW